MSQKNKHFSPYCFEWRHTWEVSRTMYGTEDEEVDVESMSLDPLSELLKQGYVS